MKAQIRFYEVITRKLYLLPGRYLSWFQSLVVIQKKSHFFALCWKKSEKPDLAQKSQQTVWHQYQQNFRLFFVHLSLRHVRFDPLFFVATCLQPFWQLSLQLFVNADFKNKTSTVLCTLRCNYDFTQFLPRVCYLCSTAFDTKFNWREKGAERHK